MVSDDNLGSLMKDNVSRLSKKRERRYATKARVVS